MPSELSSFQLPGNSGGTGQDKLNAPNTPGRSVIESAKLKSVPHYASTRLIATLARAMGSLGQYDVIGGGTTSSQPSYAEGPMTVGALGTQGSFALAPRHATPFSVSVTPSDEGMQHDTAAGSARNAHYS